MIMENVEVEVEQEVNWNNIDSVKKALLVHNCYVVDKDRDGSSFFGKLQELNGTQNSVFKKAAVPVELNQKQLDNDEWETVLGGQLNEKEIKYYQDGKDIDAQPANRSGADIFERMSRIWSKISRGTGFSIATDDMVPSSDIHPDDPDGPFCPSKLSEDFALPSEIPSLSKKVLLKLKKHKVKELPFSKIDKSNLHHAFVAFVEAHNRNVIQFQKLLDNSQADAAPDFRWSDQTANLERLIRIANKMKLARLINDERSIRKVSYLSGELQSIETLDNILEKAIEIRNSLPPDPIESMNKVSTKLCLHLIPKACHSEISECNMSVSKLLLAESEVVDRNDLKAVLKQRAESELEKYMKFQWKFLALKPKAEALALKLEVSRDFIAAHHDNVLKMQQLLDDPAAIKVPVKYSAIELKRLRISDVLVGAFIELKDIILENLSVLYNECFRKFSEAELFQVNLSRSSMDYRLIAEYAPELQLFRAATRKWPSSVQQYWTDMRGARLKSVANCTTVREACHHSFAKFDRFQSKKIMPGCNLKVVVDVSKGVVLMTSNMWYTSHSTEFLIPSTTLLTLKGYSDVNQEPIVLNLMSKYDSCIDIDDIRHMIGDNEPLIQAIFSMKQTGFIPITKRWIFSCKHHKQLDLNLILPTLKQSNIFIAPPKSVPSYRHVKFDLDDVRRLAIIEIFGKLFGVKFPHKRSDLESLHRFWHPNSYIEICEDKLEKAAHCIRYTDVTTLSLILENDSENIHLKRTQFNETLLETACDVGFIEGVQILARKGSDLEIKDSNGRTPLIRAVCNGHVDVVKALLAFGASFALDSNGLSPLHWACKRLQDPIDLIEKMVIFRTGKSEFIGDDRFFPPFGQLDGFSTSDEVVRRSYFRMRRQLVARYRAGSCGTQLLDLLLDHGLDPLACDNNGRDMITSLLLRVVEAGNVGHFEAKLIAITIKPVLFKVLKSIVAEKIGFPSEAAEDAIEFCVNEMLRYYVAYINNEYDFAVLQVITSLIRSSIRICRGELNNFTSKHAIVRTTSNSINLQATPAIGDIGLLLFVCSILQDSRYISINLNSFNAGITKDFSIGKIGIYSMCKLSAMNRIIDLSLCAFHLTEEDSASFASAINEQSPLKSLTLSRCQFDSNSLELIIKSLSHCMNLVELSLTKLTINSSATIALVGLISTSKSLQILNFQQATFEEGGIVSVMESVAKNVALTTLSLTAVSMTSAEADVVKRCIKSHVSIKALGLKMNISDNSSYSFEEVLRNNNVMTSLELTNPQDASILLSYAVALKENANTSLVSLEGIALQSMPVRRVLGLDDGFKKMSNTRILAYLHETRSVGTVTVRRIRVVFVGNGETGKTTLIRRLRENIFDEHALIMTDGIDISYLTIDNVEMTVFDFAGQPEYEHTHPLFFDNQAIYLLLHNPRVGAVDRLNMFLEMIMNSAPQAKIIMVATRADEALMAEEQRLQIMARCPNIESFFAVDSKSGRNIDQLKASMVSLALKNPNTTKTIPTTFEKFRNQLNLISLSQFSVPYAQAVEMCYKSYGMTANLVDIALQLFECWGKIFRLSNDDIVLHPQQLANVMSCVFTKVESTKRRIGDVKEGVLKHVNDVLDAIWSPQFPNLSKSMWRCTNNIPISPFLALLYQSGLAFQLFDEEGKSMKTSLVPALLPAQPAGYQSFERDLQSQAQKAKEMGRPVPPKLSDAEIYCKMFIPSDLPVHPTVVLVFERALPTPFLGRLQVGLRRMVVLGGSWKRGCCLAFKASDQPLSQPAEEGNNDPPEVKIQSMVILYQPEGDTAIHFYSAGTDTSARSAAISTLLNLMESKYPSISAPDVKLTFDGREYNRFDIIDNLEKGYILHKRTNQKLAIANLRVFFPEIMQQIHLQQASEERAEETAQQPESSSSEDPTTNDDSQFNTEPKVPLKKSLSRTKSKLTKPLTTFSLRDPKNASNWKGCPPVIVKKLIELEVAVEQAERDLEENDENDVVYLSEKLMDCLSAFLMIMGVKVRKKGLSTIWVVIGTAKSPKVFAIPVSPTRVKGNDCWYPLIEEARIDVSEALPLMEETDNWRRWIAGISASLVQRCFKAIDVPMGRWRVQPFLLLSDWADDMKRKEMNHFTEIDGIYLMNKYFENANKMIVGKQLNKITSHEQAQERLLSRVIQQNEENTKILTRIEQQTFKISEQLVSEFANIGKLLTSSGNQEGLEELKQVWEDKMNALERLIVAPKDSKEFSAEAMDKLMFRLEVMMDAKLSDLYIDSNAMTQQLGDIKAQLKEAHQARVNGEANADNRLQTILGELRGLQSQLDVVQQMVSKVFESLETHFADIRSQLAENTKGLNAVREVWIKKLDELDKSIESAAKQPNADIQQLLDQQMSRFQKMMTATLVDVEVDHKIVTEQLKSIREELFAAAQARQRGDEEGQQRWNVLMQELRGMQTQLAQVINLQQDAALALAQGLNSMKKFIVNVNVRSYPTSFVIIPKINRKDQQECKSALTRMYDLYQTVKKPKEAIIDCLRDQYYIALLCEACHQPPEDASQWYPVSKPKDTVGRLLPLANAGLKLATMVNAVSGLGRIFGLPTPVLQDTTFEQAQQFIDKLGSDSLDDFPSLQANAEANYATAKKASVDVTVSQPSNNQPPMELGYCIREFGEFLHEVDPKKIWGLLSARVDSNGDLCFLCKTCIGST